MTGPSDDGQAGVTEDLTKARALVTHADYCSGFGDRGDECICSAAEIAERVAAALAAEREKARTEVLTEQGACGDLSPTFDVGSAALAPVMCNLPPGHKGAHCASDGTPFPMRWIRRAAEEGQQ